MKNMSFVLRGAVAALATVVSFSFAAPVVASSGVITAAEDGANRINIAGRQRMLSQRMAKAACFISMGVEIDAHLNILRTSKLDFERSLIALRDGSFARRMLPPSDPTIEASLTPVFDAWQPFYEAVKVVLENPADNDAIDFIANNNVALLSLSDAAVTVMADVYGGSALSADMANTINIAGRQRMLSQKLSKSFCQTLRWPTDSVAQDEFIGALDLFGASHRSLLSGDPAAGIVVPPSDDVKLQLILVDNAGVDIQADLELAAAGIPSSTDVIERVSALSDVLLVEMNKAVGLYGEANDANS